MSTRASSASDVDFESSDDDFERPLLEKVSERKSSKLQPERVMEVDPADTQVRHSAAGAAEDLSQQPRVPRYNAEWVRTLQEEIQTEIERDGTEACKWARLLEKWSHHIREVPYERVGTRLDYFRLLEFFVPLT